MKKVFVVTGILIVLLFDVAHAGPIGSPTATLEQGTGSVGVDLTSQRQDLQIFGTGLFDGVIEDYDNQQTTATLSYGVTDRFEVFGRVGYLEGDGTIDGERVMGAGARLTLSENPFDVEGLSIGMTGQFSLARLDVSVPVTIGHCWWKRTIPVDMSVDLFETIMAVGATYEIDDFTVYGGPALYRLDGDIEATSSKWLGNEDGSLKSDKVIGYVGASWNCWKDIKLTGEFQFAPDHQSIGIGASIPF